VLNKKHGLSRLTALSRRFFTTDGSKGSTLWLVLRLLALVVLVVAVCVAYYMQNSDQEIDCINC
jgi:FK506-binding protein 4/5